jgi:protein-tyrosine phosphatase
MKRILVVCEGNICRSPMAQGVLAHSLPGINVSSAGLGALIGYPADPWAISLMAERRIDIAAHRARQITRPICAEADLILVMTSEQKHRLADLYPEFSGRVFRLGEHARSDIPDPFRLGESAFRGSLAILDECLASWLPRIRRLTESTT